MKDKKDTLQKTSSKYILIKIFNILKEERLLNLINQNKKLQKIMMLKKKDYENEYFKIKLELFPIENIYGKFINYLSHTKIYFNDMVNEIKNKFITKNNEVHIIRIINRNKKSLSNLFYGCKYIKKIKITKFKREDIEDISFMFDGCSSLEEIKFINFNTNNVTNMSSMFRGCSSLKKLNLSKFNTNNINNMSFMFRGCLSLKKLNLSNFKTNNILKMIAIFGDVSH